MKRLPSLIVALAVALPPAASAGQSEKLGPDPVLAGGYYSTGGGLSIAVELRPMNGRTGICGAWAESASLAGHLAGKSRELLGSGAVYVGGTKVRHGLGFLKQVAPAPSYAGAPANCVITSRPWRPGDAGKHPEVRIPRKTVVMNRGAAGIEIRFRQAQGANPAMERGSLIPPEWKHFPSTQVGAGQDRPNS